MSSTVVDLFSGVGGLSLGAVKAGFNLAGAVEYDKRILEAHSINFPNSQHLGADISKLSRQGLLSGLNIVSSDIAGIIGGPPCQGFSSIGKRAADDSRNQLFLKFFELVSAIGPAFFLAENVPGILDDQYQDIRDKARKIVSRKYLILDPIRISANDYGAATTRTRVFFIGVRKDIKGYEKLRDGLAKFVLKNGTQVKEALAGLPVKISENWLTYEDSWRKIKSDKVNRYVAEVNRIIPNVGNTKAIDLFKNRNLVSGCFGTRHSKDVVERFLLLKPGSQDPISKSVKLRTDGFCPTLRAGTDNTKGSFQAVRPIHPSQPRVITPREAARLQGFPDWFTFHATKWHSFRMIGNSVCPVVAEQVLRVIKTALSL